jgi:hypothetical protein
LTVVPVALCIALAITTIYYRDRAFDAENRLNSSYFRQSALENDVRRLREMAAQFENPPLQLEPTLTGLELATLQKQGFEDPYRDLARDLAQNPTIVSADGQPVTSFDVKTEDDTCILSPNRALAFYEADGERGKVLLGFEIGGNNQISWRILEKQVSAL